METHAGDPHKNVIAVIPARRASTRLADKMLLEIAGKPLILHTVERAKRARTISRVVVATDDAQISDVVTATGYEAVMTSASHASGSDRIAEVAETLPGGSIVVNVQGDEPLISPQTIDAAVNALVENASADISTACEPMTGLSELLDVNVVKALVAADGRALYFSRSPVPWPREAVLRHGDLASAIQNEPELLSLFRKHTGLYVYRREYLLSFTKLAPTRLETTEMLEQLRALENGAKIVVVDVKERSVAVDTQEDLDRVRALLETR